MFFFCSCAGKVVNWKDEPKEVGSVRYRAYRARAEWEKKTQEEEEGVGKAVAA